MQIISRAKYKLLAGIGSDTYNSRIDALIPTVEKAYLNQRNAPLDGDVWPGCAEATAMRMLNFLIFSKREEGQDSVNLGAGMNIRYGKMLDGFPEEIMKEIVRFVGVSR